MNLLRFLSFSSLLTATAAVPLVSADPETLRSLATGQGKRGSLVTVKSQFSFTETYDKLIHALNDAPVVILENGEIDHAKAAADAGLELLAPNRVVFFGNPALGTPLMLKNR